MPIEYRCDLIYESEINDFYNNKNTEYRSQVILENEYQDFNDINYLINLINLFTTMKIN